MVDGFLTNSKFVSLYGEQYEKAFHGAKGNNLVAGFRDCGLVPPSFEKLWDKTEEFRAQKERENDDALARALEFPKTPSPAPPVLATRDCQTNPRELERRPLSATRADLTQPKATRAAPKRKRAEEVDSDSDSTEQLSEPSEVELETGHLVEGSAAKLPQGPTSCPENFNWRAWVRKRRETEAQRTEEGRCVCNSLHTGQSGWWAECEVCGGWVFDGCGGLAKKTHKSSLDAGAKWMCSDCAAMYQDAGGSLSSAHFF